MSSISRFSALDDSFWISGSMLRLPSNDGFIRTRISHVPQAMSDSLAARLRPVTTWAAILTLVLLAEVRSAVATRTDGFTVDEAYHIAAGVSYVRTGDFRLNPEHPPLVKLWAGAVVSPGFRLAAFRPLADKLDERVFTDSAVFFDDDPVRVQVRARAAMMVLNGLLLLFLAGAVIRAFGPPVAIATAGVLAIDPTVAAQLPVVMTDLPVALLAPTAVLFTVCGLCKGSRLDLTLGSLALGLTLSAKHSGLVALLAVVAVGVLIPALPRPAGEAGRPGRVRTLGLTLAVAVGALVVLWGLYGFRYAESHAGEEAFNRPLALKIEDLRGSTSRAALRLATSARVLPRAYIWGLADTMRAGLEGRNQPVPFLGRVYFNRGPLHYFPAVLAAKLPFGLLALALAGVVLLGTRVVPAPWRLPGLCLLALAGAFLIALMRGASYGGVRHALPVLVSLAICGGMALAMAATHSRIARSLALGALGLGALSAVPRMRPWEYHNELFGGPGNGYRYFADEGVDMGQRSLDFARYYHERLEPAGEVPYLFYPMSGPEVKARRVRVRDPRGSEADWTDVPESPSGVFFVSSVQMMRGPRFAPFREAVPVDRIGNLLIFRGSFSLPWIREENLIRLGRESLASTRPDLDKAKSHFQQALAVNAHSFGALLNLGNIALRRGQCEQALDFYVRARDEVREDLAMREALIKQIDRVSREPLDVIPPLRGTRVE